ncbi:MAG: MBL fold metallo-hydrolase [Armatimonadetes bacterium]|nr:MBL fold metallo-hydrolase [Armatimonadota bacterium]
MNVVYDRGIYLPEQNLWLDPQARQAVAFVSHAHADHTAAHQHVLCSVPTAAFMRRRGVIARQFRALSYRRPCNLGAYTLTLYPAGHILGSAQALVTAHGTRLLYSGDFKLRPGRAAEPIEVPEADVVVVETTFGRPRYRFPPTEEVAAEIRAWCAATLESGDTPVLLCYPLGKGQELLAHLGELGTEIFLHRSHAEMAALYREFGIALPPYRVYEPGQRPEGVLVAPPQVRRAHWFERLPRKRTAFVSGWAVDAGARWRMGVDVCFPLSDHADYEDLLAYVGRTSAGRIYTVHGFAREFALDLRALGYDAVCLSEVEAQLPLF